MDFKRCTKCGADKPLEAYTPDPRKRGGREHACRICRQSRRSKGAAKLAHLRRAYGLVPSDVSAIAERQNGQCPICRRGLAAVKRTHIDHCHSTGRVRGILCSECNTGIGKLKDSPELLRRALAYLET